jgi:predicted peroxiredoxin
VVAAGYPSPTPPCDSYRDVKEATGERAEAGDEQAHEPDLSDHTEDLMLCRMSRSLVIKVTAGSDAPERCSQAFTVAATAAAAGVGVSLWLTGESAWFALPGRAEQFELPHAAPLQDLLNSVLAAGTVTLCTQCAARRGITPDAIISGVRVAGSAVFVEEVLGEDVQALVY